MRLQSQGQSVVILEAGTVGAGASLGNAGHIATEQVFPLQIQALLSNYPQCSLIRLVR